MVVISSTTVVVQPLAYCSRYNTIEIKDGLAKWQIGGLTWTLIKASQEGRWRCSWPIGLHQQLHSLHLTNSGPKLLR